MDEDAEFCSICWRNFSIDIKPCCMPCGHSYCTECSKLLKTCPLCRKKIPQNHVKVPNYSLVSLIERIEKTRAVEKLHKSTETDIIPNQIIEQQAVNTIKQRRSAPVQSLKKTNMIKFKIGNNSNGKIQTLQLSFS